MNICGLWVCTVYIALLFAQFLLQTVGRVDPKVMVRRGVDRALGAQTAISWIFWARCREARVIRGVAHPTDGLVLRVIDLVVTTLEHACRVQVRCVAIFVTSCGGLWGVLIPSGELDH